MSLVLIYHFSSSRNLDGDWKPASYKVIYFFSEQSFLEESLLQEMAKAIADSDHQLLTFLNLDDLKAFALRVAQELQRPSVRMLSVQDYNIGIDGASELSGYREIFSKYGEVVINQEARKKKGLLGKLFS